MVVTREMFQEMVCEMVYEKVYAAKVGPHGKHMFHHHHHMLYSRTPMLAAMDPWPPARLCSTRVSGCSAEVDS
jgi:hypothetical protein